nr:hypothetical protein CFP56_06367 [Quercus suber]
MVNSWKAALKDVANLSGLHLKPFRESATDQWQIDVPEGSAAIVVHNIPSSKKSEWARIFCENFKHFFIWYLLLCVVVPLIIFVVVYINQQKTASKILNRAPPSG